MRRLALSGVLLLFSSAAAMPEEFTLEPFVGIQYGGAFRAVGAGRTEIGVGLQYGAALDVAIGGQGWGAQAFFARQDSELEGVPRRDVAVERYMAGVREEKGNERFRFRGVFLVGATRFAVDGLGSGARFTVAPGLGASVWLSPRLGLRADVRAYYAVASFSAGSVCVDGSCLYLFGSTGVWQGDLTAGLQLRF